VCAELEAALRSFRDVETGTPIVDRVYRQGDLAPSGAPYRDLLPDLLVTWGQISAINCRAIRSERYGEMRLDAAGRLPSGRAGNHTNRGWVVVAGNGIEQGGRLGEGHIMDLAPTLLSWLGAEAPATFQGKPMQAGSKDALALNTR
jgi:predicted AlkP superfamily phosphohydrolase/phosphomutase